MIGDIFVINPTVHAYNLRDDNLRDNEVSRGFRKTLWGLHSMWNPPEYQVSQEMYYSDWSAELLARTLFLESQVDLAGNQNLRLDSWFHDGLCSREKNVEVAERWPDRFLTYVGVDPTAGLDVCLRELREQMAELPRSVGLKLYPDQVQPLRSWRMDDPSLAYPLFEAAQELGIRTIAVHKAVPNGPVPMNPYRVDDVDGAAIHFPDLNFEIVHSGLAFADETAHAIGRFPNVYANLEITSLLLHKRRGFFEEILGLFMMWAGTRKIIYSDGSLFCHSRPLLERLVEFQLSERALDTFGVEQLTMADKALILGGNYARLVGLDIEQAKARIADDEFSRTVREHGLAEPYSNWRAMAGADRVVTG